MKWNPRTVALYTAWLVAAAMLVSAATERHPYAFYTLLRWVCSPIFLYSALISHERKLELWTWIFGVLALLYNPLIRVHLDRNTWTNINWITVAAIVLAGIFFGRSVRKS